MNKVICKAISICGSRQKLADLCQVSDMTVGNWLKGTNGINGKYIQSISDATNGEVTVAEIVKSLSGK